MDIGKMHYSGGLRSYCVNTYIIKIRLRFEFAHVNIPPAAEILIAYIKTIFFFL